MAMQFPTPASVQADIETLVKKLEPTMSDLWYRWQDEREYEDIREYGKVLAALLPTGYTYRRMTSRPFAIHFDVGDQTGYQIFLTGTSMGWKRKR